MPTPMNHENHELVGRFLGRYSPGTRGEYGRHVRQFQRFLGKPLQEVTAQDCSAFAFWLRIHEWRRVTQCGRYSTATVLCRLSTVRTFVRFLRAEGIVSISEAELQAATAPEWWERDVRNAYMRAWSRRRHRRRRA